MTPSAVSTGRRRTARQGRRGDLLRSGQVIGITETNDGWRAVVAEATVIGNADPVVTSLKPFDALNRHQRLRADAWLSKLQAVEAMPSDLAKLRDRYTARAVTSSGGRARDAKLVLDLLQRLAKAEAASNVPTRPQQATNDNR